VANRFQWLKNLYTQNLGLKLLSLMLAILTFHAIRSATSDEDIHVLPVDAQVDDENMEIVEQDPLSVTVTFRGSREDLKRLDPKYMKIILRPGIEDEGEIRIRSRDIKGARGLRIVKIDPEYARFTLARRSTPDQLHNESLVPPKIEEPPPGMGRVWTNLTVLAAGVPGTAASVILEPPLVNVHAQAPERVLEAFADKVPVVFVNCSDLDQAGTVTRPVNAYFPGQGGLRLKVDPASVKITFEPNEPE